MEIQEIIDKWKLNRALLASKLGMPKGTFNNKLSSKHPTKFSDQEMYQLKQTLIELYNDLDGIEQDFNVALGMMVK
jgi:hypothetical protein